MEPVESTEYPGYFRIPGFENYAINRDGEVVNLISGEKSRGSRTRKGYVELYFRKDGRRHRILRHRVLGCVFLHPGVNVNLKRGLGGTDLVINHKNGIKGSDALENLEWVTVLRNIHHAGELGLTDKCIPMSVRIHATGEILRFPSRVECSNHFNISIGQIGWRLKYGEDIVYPEGNQYRLGHSDDPWPEPKSVKKVQGERSKRVLIRLIKRDYIFEVESLKKAAEFLGTKPSVVSKLVNNPTQPCFKGIAQLQWADTEVNWKTPEPSKLGRTGKRVEMVNVKTGITTVFETLRACIKATGLAKSTLSAKLTRVGFYQTGDIRFCYVQYGPDDQ